MKSTSITRESDKADPRVPTHTSNVASEATRASASPSEGAVSSSHLFHKSTFTRSLSQSKTTLSIALFTKTFEDSAYLDYVPNLLLSPQRSQVLDTCFEAVSLLYCSQHNSYASLLPEARETYHKAIPQVQNAISDTGNFSSDDLLASIMLLALYTLLLPDASNLDMWALHFQGAVALLLQRSPEYLHGKAVQNILSHMLSFGAMHAFQTWQPMSPQLLSCLRYSLQVDHSIQVRFWQILVAVTELQHTIKSSENLEPEMIDRLQATDEQVKSFYNLCAHGPAHERDVWQEHGHENDYPVRRKMQPLNNLRVARIRLNELIYIHATYCIESHKYSFGQDRTQLESQALRARQTVETLAEQICHSIPETFRPEHAAGKYPANLDAWIFGLAWPLVEVIDASLVSQKLRASAALQLRWFSEISSNDAVINMASELAKGSRNSGRYFTW